MLEVHGMAVRHTARCCLWGHELTSDTRCDATHSKDALLCTQAPQPHNVSVETPARVRASVAIRVPPTMWVPTAPPALLCPPTRQAGGAPGTSHSARQAPAGRASPSQHAGGTVGLLHPATRQRLRSPSTVAGAGVRDRGEWTRFLEWNDSGDGLSAGTRASVECMLTDANTAAEVTVTAPDRPGLLSDISRAMASTGFNIDKVRLRGSLPPAAKATQGALRGGPVPFDCLLFVSRR